MSTSLKNTRYLATLGIFVAIIILMGVTPNLGFITITPAFSIVTIHVAVITGAVLLGPKAGAILGLFFGLMSIYKGFVAPSPVEAGFITFLFSKGNLMGIVNLIVILIFPRVMIGIVAAYVHRILSKFNIFSKVAAGIAGTLTNSVLFLGILYLLYGKALVSTNVIEVLSAFFAGIIATNALFEIGLAAVLTPALTIPILKAIKR